LCGEALGRGTDLRRTSFGADARGVFGAGGDDDGFGPQHRKPIVGGRSSRAQVHLGENLKKQLKDKIIGKLSKKEQMESSVSEII
jgi:hypothetical protein